MHIQPMGPTTTSTGLQIHSEKSKEMFLENYIFWSLQFVNEEADVQRTWKEFWKTLR